MGVQLTITNMAQILLLAYDRTRQCLAQHSLEPVPCLDIQVDEALFAIRGSVQGEVGDEVVSCLWGATVAVARGSQDLGF